MDPNSSPIDDRYMLLAQSYLSSKEDYVKLAEELKKALRIQTRIEQPYFHYTFPSEKVKVLAGDVMNVSEKLGAIIYFGELVRDVNAIKADTVIQKRNATFETKILLTAYIYQTKAFLDSIAYLLNNLYLFELYGNDIALDKGALIKKLEKHEPSIAILIKQRLEWIQRVTKWRQNLIHRFTTEVGFRVEHTGKSHCILVDDPDYAIGMLYGEETEPKKRLFREGRNVTEICEEWTAISEGLAKGIFQHLIESYRDR